MSLFKIGEYIFDTELAELKDAFGEITTLEPLHIKLLTFLIRNTDRLVGKRELMLRVWEREVSNATIDKAISILRKAFKDTPRQPIYIASRYKLGYRLIAPTREYVKPTVELEPPMPFPPYVNNELKK